MTHPHKLVAYVCPACMYVSPQPNDFTYRFKFMRQFGNLAPVHMCERESRPQTQPPCTCACLSPKYPVCRDCLRNAATVAVGKTTLDSLASIAITRGKELAAHRCVKIMYPMYSCDCEGEHHV